MIKKKFICVMVSVLMIFSITGCRIPGNIWKNPNLNDVYPFIDVMVGDDFLEEWHENGVISRVKWQKLSLSDYDSGIYPELQKTFMRLNKENETTAKAMMYESKSTAEELYGDIYSPPYCGAESRFYTQRADRYAVSILEGTEVYSGGIHPDYFWNGKNFKPDTGEMLLLTDVLTDMKELSSILDKKLTEKYENISFPDLKECFDYYKAEDFTWTIDYQGINFWFSPYEIAAYSAGSPSVKIWFDEYPDMFNEKYTDGPENYAITVPLGLDIDFDLATGDGKRDLVFAETLPDYYGNYEMLSVVVNGKTYADEINYAYEFLVYLVHNGDKNYIYAESVSDNDYRMLEAFDINGNVTNETDLLYGTGFYGEVKEDDSEFGTYYKNVLNNPGHFILQKRFEILGTREGIAAFSAGEADGKFEMKEEVFSVEGGFEVMLKTPLELELVKDKSLIVFPEGTALYPLYTDGETYIVMKTDDGTEVKLSYDQSTWPRMVNGIPEDECFEELLYAG